jgi:hypothetical protein
MYKRPVLENSGPHSHLRAAISIASCPSLRSSDLIHLCHSLLELLVLALLVAMAFLLLQKDQHDGLVLLQRLTIPHTSMEDSTLCADIDLTVSGDAHSYLYRPLAVEPLTWLPLRPLRGTGQCPTTRIWCFPTDHCLPQVQQHP